MTRSSISAVRRQTAQPRRCDSHIRYSAPVVRPYLRALALSRSSLRNLEAAVISMESGVMTFVHHLTWMCGSHLRLMRLRVQPRRRPAVQVLLEGLLLRRPARRQDGTGRADRAGLPALPLYLHLEVKRWRAD